VRQKEKKGDLSSAGKQFLLRGGVRKRGWRLRLSREKGTSNLAEFQGIRENIPAKNAVFKNP